MGSVIVFLFAFFLAVFGVLSQLIFLFGLLFVAVVPGIYQRWFRVALGIEFLLFASVIAGLKFGAVTGFGFAFVAKVLSDVLNRTVGEWTFLNAFAMGCGAVVAALLGEGTNILVVGMAAVVVVELVSKVPFFLVGGVGRGMLSFLYILGHVLFNLWLFSKVAPLLGFK